MNRPKRIISLIFHDAGRQFGFTGAPGAITPSVDQMASEGVSFASHFSTGTVCIPSRASLLTGKYLHSAEIAHLVHDENTLPRLMSRAGYKTKRVGFAEEKEYRSIAGRRYSEDFDLSGKELLGYDESDTALRQLTWRIKSVTLKIADGLCLFMVFTGPRALQPARNR